MEIDFYIEHIDPLGQGVDKSGERVTFISKTLPQETGRAKIYRQKMGVYFALPTQIETQSPLRTPSPCPHYEYCLSCHYLHTSYEHEIKFKENALKWALRSFNPLPPINIHQATSRYQYRNRIQLHYDLKFKRLGLMADGQIVNIAGCLLPIPEIQEQIEQLYQQNSWIKLLNPKSPPRGHIELYWKDNQLQINCNQPYSGDGFTQVNSEMNELLKRKVNGLLTTDAPRTVLELFGGNGNLTSQLQSTSVYVVDNVPAANVCTHQTHISLDLYGATVLKELISHLGPERIETIILDPPRSGLSNLCEFTTHFACDDILYISCNPATLARDIKTIQEQYQLRQIDLLDLFPATRHFETLIYLERKK